MPHKRSKRSIREAETKAKGYNLAPSQSKEYDDTPRGATRIFNSINYQTQFRASGRTNSEDTGERGPKKRKVVPGQEKNGESSRSAASASGMTEGVSRKGKEKEKDQPTKEALPKIRDNESLADYNRRIESLLRPGVAKAIKSANSVKAQQAREAREEKKRRKAGPPDPALAAAAERAKEDETKVKRNAKHDISDPAKNFKSTERRRLNDIVQAPPMLPHLKKGMGPGGKKKASGGETSAWKATGRMPVNAGQERLLNAERERVVKAYREIKAERELKKAAARAAEAK